MNKPFHPLLFAIYPILFLYSQNKAEFTPDVMIVPILISLALTVFAMIILWIFSKNKDRSLFLLSIFMIVFLSYGHFYDLLERAGISSNPKVALTVCGFILLFLLILCWKAIQDWKKGTRFLNVLSIALIALALIGTVSSIQRSPSANLRTVNIQTSASGAEKPDIFYIILDGYPRRDTLQMIHQFDNSNLLEFLQSKGFRILSRSHSNYPGTALSLASSLNFSYLDEIVPANEIRANNRWFLKNLIVNNRTFEFLRKQGYAIAAFDSGYFSTEIQNADYFYATGWFFNEFHEALVDTTPLWVIFKNIGRYQIQRRRILHVFDHIGEPKDPERPVFVFAHLMALHPPFVFGPNGEEPEKMKSSLQFWKEFGEPTAGELSNQYQDQLTFINQKARSAIESILKSRTRPVVIILQGDHGSSFIPSDRQPDFYRERFSILNAILMPEPNQLYDSMSPVNTFRVIFNTCFQTDLPLLSDRGFYSKRDEPFDLKEVTSILGGKD
jgi:hypothetical protein